MKHSIRTFQRNLICFLCMVFVAISSKPGNAAGDGLVTWDDLAPNASISTNAQPDAPDPHAATQNTGSETALPRLDPFDPFNDGLLVSEEWAQEAYEVEPGLVNTQVSIDGHVLPLAWENDRVTEFLLVPWVGACIHTPAPPPNQIVHISYADGLQINEQFDALRFTGTLRHDAAKHDLYLIDGRRQIPASYALTEVSAVGPAGEISSSAAQNLPLTSRIQIWANSLFTSSMASMGTAGGYKALFSALMLSFAYGVFHTFGPGHGKTVVVSYFVGVGGTFRRGMVMGARIAVIHVLSAIVIVFAFDLAVRQVTGLAPSDYRSIRLASYGLIIAIGATMLWRAVSSALAQKRQSTAGKIDESHHHHHKHAHGHAHGQHAGCAACAAAEEAAKGSGWIAASVGLVPCTGALLVMLYGLANDLMVPAILMVIAISAGMALAMTAIGVLAIWGRNLSEKRIAKSSAGRQSFETSARLVGSSCVLAIGCLLFFLTLANPIAIPPLSGGSNVALQASPGSEG